MGETLALLILGFGYTGQRVAKRFLAVGACVTVTTRNPQRLASVGTEIIGTSDLSKHVGPGMLVLHFIPPDGPANLVDPLRNKARRIVYPSSTAVDGVASLVNERTLEAERAIAEGTWISPILRPAVIYGPGRSVQELIQREEHSFSDSFVSRIHVDDLAAHSEAALLSTITGAYPVADEGPGTSCDIAESCARPLNVPVTGTRHERADLTYPSYRIEVPAALSGPIHNAGAGCEQS